MTTLRFEPVERTTHRLRLPYSAAGLGFETSYWYDSIDLHDLAERLGPDLMRLLEFHILAFEANKAASLAPTAIDFGPYDDLVTNEFWELWETIFRNVWAVWRYENGLPDYRLPTPERLRPGRPRPTAVDPADVPTLMMCGGGKDSLASMTLLEHGGIDYDAFVYSHSTYGRGGHQHDLIDGVLAHTHHERLHRGWVIDDAIDAPVARLHPEHGIDRILAAETVSSYWTALPVALAHGHTAVALGITRSTDEHNLTWDRTGEDVNYLWGMSTAAEELLHDYIRAYIASNLSMFHILRPVHDVNVFTLLNRRLDAVPATHSCAQLKPWCCRCAKCLYVWMNYVAWLPEEVVAATFDANMFEITENRVILRKMLGLESYKPTDCVGTVSEARLAFLMCRQKGITGAIADEIDLAPFETEAHRALARYASVGSLGRLFPDDIARAVGPQLAASEADAHRLADDVLADGVGTRRSR